MKSVSTAARRAAVVVALLITMAVPAAYGDEPFEPPQARINPPGGSPSRAAYGDEPSEPPPQARINPPIGSPSQAEPSSIALFANWLWLRLAMIG